jgi:hypothetical protein
MTPQEPDSKLPILASNLAVLDSKTCARLPKFNSVSQLTMTSGPNSYIGKRIALISNNNIRYEGILKSVDPVGQLVTLTSGSFTLWLIASVLFLVHIVQVPPSNDVYEYIIFRGSDISELALLEVTTPSPFVDPAIQSAVRETLIFIFTSAHLLCLGFAE